MKDVAEYTKINPEERNKEIMSLQYQIQGPLRERNINLESDQRVVQKYIIRLQAFS